MKLRIFESDHGDCMLLQSVDGKNILCDGGMRNSMKHHVRAQLPNLVGTSGKLDFVYISHIDQDHISGVLQLLEDAIEWKVFDHHRANGDRSVHEPRFPRPPEIGGIWHNAFNDLITKNRGAIKNLLAAAVPVHFGSSIPELVRSGADALDITNSIPEALKVSRLVRPDLLDIQLNVLPGRSGPGKLLFRRQGQASFEVGSLNLKIVGPGKTELDDLRKGWDNWLRAADNRRTTRTIRAEMRRRVEEFASGTLHTSPFDLRRWNNIPDVGGVTTPNVASLLLMVEEDGKRLLLTGDSQQDIILDGLASTGFLDNEHIHLDVLKVQHHGSEYNMDANFCRRVSADHYVFGGNGSHGNPEPEVLDFIYQSRVGAANRRALAPKAANRRFTFWFSTAGEKQTPGSDTHTAFTETERIVAKMVNDSDGLMAAEFNRSDFRTLTI